MKVGIILVGTEMLNGAMIDTNSIYISEVLNRYAVEIEFKMIVRDIESEIIKAIDYAKKNVDLLIMSGGLGPTIDDITKAAIGKYLNLPLIVEDEEMEELRVKFKNINLPFIKSNIKQIEKPVGAISFKNDVGMAPAMYIDDIVAFPGIPKELYNMFPKFIEWYSKKKNFRIDHIYIKDILTYGLGESILDDMVKDLFTEGKIHYEFLVKSHGTIVRLQSFFNNKQNVEKVVKKIYDKIGDYIFGEDNDTLEEVLVKLLLEKNLTVSTGESCTGGLIASKIIGISGASKVYKEGFVTYSNEAKEKYLSVNAETLSKYGAVSEETAIEMVTGLHSDTGIATTGIAGPLSDETNKPVGLVYIAVKVKDKISVKKYNFNGDRNRIRIRSTLNGIFDLIKLLKN
ncbi:MAG: CinA family nicotinamide mononucleotide deamidase-related protein [Fusobacteriaceae bacterium]|jgi:nicotinamide-nucleotide amidase|nr:CinA family nicotinamide mononucleotide deamidase-related protein [Fusobacteriaceae bacterium]